MNVKLIYWYENIHFSQHNFRYLHKKCGCVNVRPPLNESASTEAYDYRSCSLREWLDCYEHYAHFGKLHYSRTNSS